MHPQKLRTRWAHFNAQCSMQGAEREQNRCSNVYKNDARDITKDVLRGARKTVPIVHGITSHSQDGVRRAVATERCTL